MSARRFLKWASLTCVLVALASTASSTARAETGSPAPALPPNLPIRCEVLHKAVDVYTCGAGILPSAAEQDVLADKLITAARTTPSIANTSIIDAACGVITNVSPPTISGTPQPGYGLHADPGSWQSTCYPIASYGYGWNNGYGGPDYPIQSGDVGATLYVTVTACNTEGDCAPATSGGVTIQPNPAPPPPPPPVTVNISASPSSVAYNGTTTVNWNSGNASSCFATDGPVGWYGSRGTSGSWTSPPLTVQTTFTLSCSGNGTSGGGSVTVTVGGAQPPTGALTANPNPVQYGQNVTLNWSYANSTGCSAPWTSSTGASGSQSVGPITADTTYSINCGGPGGNTSGSVLVKVTGAPADTTPPSTPGTPTKAAVDQTSITIQWSSSTDNVKVAGYGLYKNGTLTTSTTGTNYTFSGLACGTSYNLAVDAYDAAGNRSGKSSISASTSACSTPPPSSTPAVSSFTSNTNGPWSGTRLVLTWSCSNTTWATISSNPTAGGAVSGLTTASGSWTTPALAAGPYAYTLTCGNATGSATAYLYVGVFNSNDRIANDAQTGQNNDPWYGGYDYSTGCRWKSQKNEDKFKSVVGLTIGGLKVQVDWCVRGGRIYKVVRMISVIGPGYPGSNWDYKGIDSYGPCSENCGDFVSLYGTNRTSMNIWVQAHWELCMGLPVVGSFCPQKTYRIVGVLIRGDGTRENTYGN